MLARGNDKEAQGWVSFGQLIAGTVVPSGAPDQTCLLGETSTSPERQCRIGRAISDPLSVLLVDHPLFSTHRSILSPVWKVHDSSSLTILIRNRYAETASWWFSQPGLNAKLPIWPP
jgi:hypothetical protein